MWRRHLWTLAMAGAAGCAGIAQASSVESYPAFLVLSVICLGAALVTKAMHGDWSAVLFFLPFLYTQLTSVGGAAIAERGLYLDEFETITFFTGAAGRLLLLIAVMAVGFQIGWWLAGRGGNPAGGAPIPRAVSVWWLLLPAAYVVISVLEIVRYGTAIGQATDRFDYAAAKSLDLTRILVTWPLMFMLIAFVAANRWGQIRIRWICLGLGLAGIGRMVLVGNKFSAIVAAAIFVFLVWEAVQSTRMKWKIRAGMYFVVGLLALPAIGALVVYHYNNISGYFSASGEVREQVLNRIAAQGGVWWVTDHEVIFNQTRLGAEHFSRQLAATWGVAEERSGLEFMSSFSTTRDLTKQFSVGSAFTMAYPAIVLLNLGWVSGATVVLLIAAYAGWIGNQLHKAASSGNTLLFLLWGRLFYLIWVTCSTGDIQDLLGVKFLANLGGALALQWLVRSTKKARFTPVAASAKA